MLRAIFFLPKGLHFVVCLCVLQILFYAYVCLFSYSKVINDVVVNLGKQASFSFQGSHIPLQSERMWFSTISTTWILDL